MGRLKKTEYKMLPRQRNSSDTHLTKLGLYQILDTQKATLFYPNETLLDLTK
jgi:hypothetical protein